MRTLFLFSFLVAFIGCDKEATPKKLTSTCVEQVNDGNMCYQLYKPVCGCNGKTYSNDCTALSFGITQFTEGACKQN